MKALIGVTENDWFNFLAGQSGIDEVNFWQPSGGHLFRALNPGGPFLFKIRRTGPGGRSFVNPVVSATFGPLQSGNI